MKKLLLIFLLTITVSCSAPPAAPPLKIGIQSIWPTYGVAFIAQEKGLFAKQGVQVILVPAAGNSGYMDTLKIYKEEQVDAAFMVFSDAIMLEAEGIATRIIYAADYSDTADIIVGQPFLNSLSELKGKKVSFEGFNTFSHLLVLKLLEQAGVHEGEFETTKINPAESAEVLEALTTNKIQAGHAYGAAATEALAKGFKQLGKAGDISQLMIEGLVVNAKVANTRREELQKVVNALVEAMDFLQHSPEEGLNIIAKHTGTSFAELEASFKRLHVFGLQENRDVFKKDGRLFKGGQEIIDFFYQKGVLVKIPDLNEVIDGQFVTATAKHP
jgi:NitT/TauT family transport system substrate-binding protein